MATPKPGEIRCPTCHRSTPPAAFCTQCGSAIPSDARIRPRGMDRDELQDRIRARRSGGDPYRRGGPADVETGYQRYEPEPDDVRARPAGPTGDRREDHFAERPRPAAAPFSPDRTEPIPRRDLTREHDDEWAAAPTAVPPDAEAPADQPAHVDNFDDAAYADEPYYEYDAWEEDRERRSGGGALAILGFLALGVLALLGGAALAGVFGEDDGAVGQATPSPTPIATALASETPSPELEPTTDATAGESPNATASPAEGEPIVFADGFVAEAQPCLPGSAGTNGCDSNAERNSGSLWVWVGFENGTENDVIGAQLIGPDGSTVGTGSIDLADIGCRPSCPGGWTYFPFSNLPAGEYQVEITRNGEPADSMTFEVG